jgi:uncharacterized protein
MAHSWIRAAPYSRGLNLRLSQNRHISNRHSRLFKKVQMRGAQDRYSCSWLVSGRRARFTSTFFAAGLFQTACQQRTGVTVVLRETTVGNGMGITIKTNLLLLAIFYFLGTTSFAASNPFDDASAAYERGDYVQAIKLFRQLAAQGHQWAQRRLGLIYAEGKGVPQDYQEAIKWYRLAAAQGNEFAQLNLGVMYTQGRGVGQDFVHVHMWFNLAAQSLSGDSRDTATKKRDRIASKMTAEQIGTAQEMARHCQESKLKNCD